MPNLRSLATCCVRPEPRPLPSTGVTRLPRYYGPIRHLTAPGPSVTGIRLAVPGHAARLPVLRALSLCTCCRHYPGTATGGPALLIRPAISAFPERVVGSACASSFSRLARRSLALRPAHSRCHQFVARFTQRLQPVRHLPDCSGCFRLEHFAGWDSHPLESAALSRRTPVADGRATLPKVRSAARAAVREPELGRTLSASNRHSGGTPVPCDPAAATSDGGLSDPSGIQLHWGERDVATDVDAALST